MSCQQQPKSKSTVFVNGSLKNVNEPIDPITLAADLRSFVDLVVYTSVIATASDIAANTTDRQVRENTLRWKLAASNFIHDVIREPDPRRGFLAVWIATSQQQFYFMQGAGKEIFGDQQFRAIEAMDRVEVEVKRFAEKHFPDAPIEEADEEIDAFASQGAAVKRFFAESVTLPDSTVQDQNAIGDILSIPLAPISGLRGLGSTPAEIRYFSNVAQGFGEMLDDMPEHARWQLELLLYEAQSLDVTQRVMTFLDEFQQQSAEIRALIEQLPDQIGENVDASVEQALLQAKSETRELIQMVFWRGVILIGIACGAGVLYRWLSPRRAR